MDINVDVRECNICGKLFGVGDQFFDCTPYYVHEIVVVDKVPYPQFHDDETEEGVYVCMRHLHSQIKAGKLQQRRARR